VRSGGATGQRSRGHAVDAADDDDNSDNSAGSVVAVEPRSIDYPTATDADAVTVDALVKQLHDKNKQIADLMKQLKQHQQDSEPPKARHGI
jgi:hypothetical protein